VIKLRAELTEALRDAIDQLFASYTRFASDPPNGDAKKFSDHHAACRSALVHLDLLMKIAKLAGADSSSADNTATRRLIRNARRAIARAEEGAEEGAEEAAEEAADEAPDEAPGQGAEQEERHDDRDAPG